MTIKMGVVYVARLLTWLAAQCGLVQWSKAAL